MPDITMCKNNNCKNKDTCYRFTATPNEHWQAYFAEPVLDKDNKCSYYIPNNIQEAD
jgi:hypothetical protein